ncbi:ciliary microtubule inner protein 5 [Odontesthes bonariensis]|uniref:ciliary microtubule inner protein 5 n=1 Tax=Odontesthes bonariensis TaxID=219752 RepID=UPI003F586955
MRASANRGERATGGQNPDHLDPVKRDQLWKVLVWKEKKATQEWEKNWNFLRDYDLKGQQRTEEPLPSYVSLFSDRHPNTSSQMLGSSLSTPEGKELVRLDRLLWGIPFSIGSRNSRFSNTKDTLTSDSQPGKSEEPCQPQS